LTAALQGRRLKLRALAEADAAELLEAVSSSHDELKRRLRWVSGVKSEADCLDFIRSCAAQAGRGESQAFAVVETKKGRLTGVAALQHMLDTPGLAEACLWIRADRQDKGYAVEAGRLLAAYALRGDAIQKLFARIDPANRAARKVLKRLGFCYEGCLRHEKRLNGRWIDQECWGLLRSEWKR
jgi:ribosomal-protein-serine acetyltransferase